MRKINIVHLVIALYGVLILGGCFSPANAQNSATKDFGIIPENIRIIRDEWGVAHIFAKTDEEVAYGLAWANAEDDFKTMQELGLVCKGLYGKYTGKQGAIYDFVLRAYHVPELVDSLYEQKISPAFKKYLRGYVQGYNQYALTHPKEIIDKGLFPITEKEILRAYTVVSMLEEGLGGQVARFFSNGFKPVPPENEIGKGSNAIAIAKNKSEDGSVMHLSNPHQPIEGVGSMYEVHLCSEEGLNVHGALWHGSPVPPIYVNEVMAVMTTTNALDMSDIFQLEINPENPDQYKMDGKWLDFKKEKIRVKVKLTSFFKPVLRKNIYQSVYGPAFKTKNGVFAVNCGGARFITFANQIYDMNKAKNFQEFKQAANYFPFENLIYADKYDTIYILNGGLVPRRNPAYNWLKTVPGNTSATLWNDFLKVDELVHNLNPASGYLYNVNHSVFEATDSCCNAKREDYPKYLNDRYDALNLRAIRFKELMQEFGNKISFDEMKKIKYDITLPQNTKATQYMKDAISYNREEKYNYITEDLEKWDMVCDSESSAAAKFLILTVWMYTHDKLTAFYKENKLDSVDVPAALKYIDHYLNKYSDKAAKLGDILRFQRGNIDEPLSGFPDAIAAIIPNTEKKGIFTHARGDGFVMFAQFINGEVRIETSQAYGNSGREESPHYNDQIQLYVNRKTKSMSLDKNKFLNSDYQAYAPK